ncbi:MAG: hypothetical protein HRT69_12830 [Flavobacteriaceae bacterium]|nr:hypothetical protein [Flavobacteriaceae bacterium]
MFGFLKKRFYKVVYASKVETRDVTVGLKHRKTLTSVVLCGNKAIEYSQQIIVKRRGDQKSLKHFVKVKLKKVKGENPYTKAILKPVKSGDIIRL